MSMVDNEMSKEEISKIAALREILFGENMTQYSREFQELRLILEKNKKETDSKLEFLLNKIEEKDQQIAEVMLEKQRLASLLKMLAEELEK